MERGVPGHSKEETHTYANAYLRRADGMDHHFDRFTGNLKTKPRSFTWHCTKVGGPAVLALTPSGHDRDVIHPPP